MASAAVGRRQVYRSYEPEERGSSPRRRYPSEHLRGPNDPTPPPYVPRSPSPKRVKTPLKNYENPTCRPDNPYTRKPGRNPPGCGISVQEPWKNGGSTIMPNRSIFAYKENVRPKRSVIPDTDSDSDDESDFKKGTQIPPISCREEERRNIRRDPRNPRPGSGAAGALNQNLVEPRRTVRASSGKPKPRPVYRPQGCKEQAGSLLGPGRPYGGTGGAGTLIPAKRSSSVSRGAPRWTTDRDGYQTRVDYSDYQSPFSGSQGQRLGAGSRSGRSSRSSRGSYYGDEDGYSYRRPSSRRY